MARVYKDKSKDSKKAVELLREAGFRVITFLVNGTFGPELLLGRQTFIGLAAIKKMIEGLET